MVNFYEQKIRVLEALASGLKTQQELAELIGGNKSSASRLLKRMTEEGVLTRSKRTYVYTKAQTDQTP